MAAAGSALGLAGHVLRRTESRGIDHLKLQKLCFYAFGAALAHGVDSDVGELVFEPWKHGPVNREVWDAFKVHKAGVIPVPADAREYEDPALRQVVEDVLDVYGRMSSWSIRCESHLETPWLNARPEARPMTVLELRGHFVRKFARGRVSLPAYLAGAASSALDGIPAARFESLRAMADAVRATA